METTTLLLGIIRIKTIKPTRIICLIAVLLTSACSPSHPVDRVMVPMRDRIKLSTVFIFPPAKQTQYPVVLIRTPYQKERLVPHYQFLAESGYVVAIQDVRGRFGSEGTFEPFVKEGPDGYDAIEWIASQPWCNGNIGMIGSSYDGWVQYCAAVEKPPHLKTIIPNCAMPDLFYELPYRCGVFVPASLLWAQIVEENATSDLSGKNIESIYARPWETLLDHLPISDLDSVVLNKKIGYFQEWIHHETKDAYWTQCATIEKLSEVKIPVFIQSGWFDAQLLGSKMAYNALTDSGNQQVKMVIGPWGHVDKESKYHQGKFIGEAADDVDLHRLYREWFDYWLKGEENGIMETPRVQLYALQSDTWYSGNEYPLSSTALRKFYLRSSNLSRLPLGGELTSHSEAMQEHVGSYSYDPANVVPFGEEEGRDIDGFLDRLEGRSDYLFYQSEPLTEKTTLLGPLSATLYASSSAKDTDWFVLLFSIPPDGGTVQYISYGLLRAKFRNGFTTPELLQPNEIYQFNIDLNQCGITLAEGGKVGLIITSSFSFPYFSKNLNTGQNSQTTTQMCVAEQKIYLSKEYPSHITFPVIVSAP